MGLAIVAEVTIPPPGKRAWIGKPSRVGRKRCIWHAGLPSTVNSQYWHMDSVDTRLLNSRYQSRVCRWLLSHSIFLKHTCSKFLKRNYSNLHIGIHRRIH
jgi:hypothetical protein